MALIECNNLSIGYKKELQRNISFNLSDGEILLINGPNGCGKSTLIKTILGEISPLKGPIKMPQNIVVEYLPQIVNYDLPISITVKEILNSFDIRVESLLPSFSEVLSKRWQDCSGGEKQKAMIYSRISKNCDVLILDEPFNHIDKKSVNELTVFLERLIKNGVIKSIILISHIAPSFSDKLKVSSLELK